MSDIDDFKYWVGVILMPFCQIITVLFFSLLPILLSAANEVSHGESSSYIEVVIKSLENGSIFIYISTFLAPYFYSLFFEGGFRTRIFVMFILFLACWSLILGSLLYSGYISRYWGGDNFPHYIEWSVFIPAIVTWYYTLYDGGGSTSSSDTSKADVDKAIRLGVNQ